MSSKNQILVNKFRVPVFKATVWLLVGSTVQNAIEYMEDRTSEKIIKQEDKNRTRAYTYAFETPEGSRKYMLFFKYTAKPGEIAHEVKHMINILFNWHEYRLSATNDEMECYYLEDMVDRVHNSVLRYKKIYKNK